jgi:predicted ATPase
MFLKSLKLGGLLSFAPDAPPVELGPLNVLIGPNASGKSNFIEAIGLLRATPQNLGAALREGGGMLDWLWKGEKGVPAELLAVVAYKSGWSLRHRLVLAEAGQKLELLDERIENTVTKTGKEKPFLYFGYENGRAMLNVKQQKRSLRREDLDPQQSVLSQRKDPDQYPELSFLGSAYERIRLYRDWRMGRDAPPRRPQDASLPNDYLMEDARNLGMVLNALKLDVPVKKAILEALRQVFDGVTDYEVKIEGNTVQIFLEEERWLIPATRLSDGTVRWLALLALLLHPSPPPLVCIEEPELGLHPDLMPPLARLLKQASERMQIVITTHSDALVDAFTDTPEDVLVCERVDGSTTMRRLDKESLSEWLEMYSLGELWSKGELGGTRW